MLPLPGLEVGACLELKGYRGEGRETVARPFVCFLTSPESLLYYNLTALMDQNLRNHEPRQMLLLSSCLCQEKDGEFPTHRGMSLPSLDDQDSHLTNMTTDQPARHLLELFFFSSGAAKLW